MSRDYLSHDFGGINPCVGRLGAYHIQTGNNSIHRSILWAARSSWKAAVILTAVLLAAAPGGSPDQRGWERGGRGSWSPRRFRRLEAGRHKSLATPRAGQPGHECLGRVGRRAYGKHGRRVREPPLQIAGERTHEREALDANDYLAYGRDGQLDLAAGDRLQGVHSLRVEPRLRPNGLGDAETLEHGREVGAAGSAAGGVSVTERGRLEECLAKRLGRRDVGPGRTRLHRDADPSQLDAGSLHQHAAAPVDVLDALSGADDHVSALARGRAFAEVAGGAEHELHTGTALRVEVVGGAAHRRLHGAWAQHDEIGRDLRKRQRAESEDQETDEARSPGTTPHRFQFAFKRIDCRYGGAHFFLSP